MSAYVSSKMMIGVIAEWRELKSVRRQRCHDRELILFESTCGKGLSSRGVGSHACVCSRQRKVHEEKCRFKGRNTFQKWALTLQSQLPKRNLRKLG